MSCGSTTCNSTNPLDAVSPSFPGLGWSWRIPLAWLDEIALRWERRRQYGQLLELDDRLLADMGLSRTIIKEVRTSPLYVITWPDSC
ncbi:DUF1127 domain-containing protein [Bradyrhizobium sp. AUGA SZCCT0431]|uniref:DUF1127 domain-containing protein n=1 Tax=Bradyrhizobium sp. AUGA SZCCT0431 TaxID=2807674 RepID=UPI001BA67068|nr:DUF1127 domain-containing protein [Bradyrhizobium sp. AUGA SZCCT0431]MBR1144096.1 DUF1127 domain-containing protein [Bradyrhizobium sp. AUGA SZCCT0431]